MLLRIYIIILLLYLYRYGSRDFFFFFATLLWQVRASLLFFSFLFTPYKIRSRNETTAVCCVDFASSAVLCDPGWNVYLPERIRMASKIDGTSTRAHTHGRVENVYFLHAQIEEYSKKLALSYSNFVHIVDAIPQI